MVDPFVKNQILVDLINAARDLEAESFVITPDSAIFILSHKEVYVNTKLLLLDYLEYKNFGSATVQGWSTIFCKLLNLIPQLQPEVKAKLKEILSKETS